MNAATPISRTPSAGGEDVVAALDIGGTKTAAALVTRTGKVLDRASARTPGSAGAQAVLETAADLVLFLRTRSAASTVRALGAGSAGVIDAGSGRVMSATDVLAGWAGTDLRGWLGKRLSLPVTALNDVHAHAVGEARHGVATGWDSVLFVAVGTGIGGAWVVNGHVQSGAHSAAGHVGHQPSPHGRSLTCSCGGTGHLEAIAAGPALAAEYGRRTGRPVPDLRAVAALAVDGDRAAQDVVRLGGTAVGSAIGGLVNVLDPQGVVVGGGVTGLGQPWWDALCAGVRGEVLPAMADVAVVPSTLGADAPLLGAASLAWEVAA